MPLPVRHVAPITAIAEFVRTEQNSICGIRSHFVWQLCCNNGQVWNNSGTSARVQFCFVFLATRTRFMYAFVPVAESQLSNWLHSVQLALSTVFNQSVAFYQVDYRQLKVTNSQLACRTWTYTSFVWCTIWRWPPSINQCDQCTVNACPVDCSLAVLFAAIVFLDYGKSCLLCTLTRSNSKPPPISLLTIVHSTCSNMFIRSEVQCNVSSGEPWSTVHTETHCPFKDSSDW